jgi:phospholipid/cholesterol/gamma-HCH transport system substrate-binding protein
MRARASNLMIGSVTLAVIAAGFVGLLGYRKIHGMQQQSLLRITFEGSASGLRKGGSVNFDGVQIGEILSLKLDTRARLSPWSGWITARRSARTRWWAWNSRD